MAQLDANQEAEVTFLSGVAADGTLAATSYWTWARNEPATYNRNYQSKFGEPTAGTGGTIRYAFTTASGWTETERGAFRSAMALWSAVANVTFAEVPDGTADAIAITRGSDRTASGGTTRYIPGTIGTRRLGQSIGDGSITIDTSVRGFGPIGAALTVEGGYPWMTIVHEVGHIVGLGHGGPYNDGDTEATPQFTQLDSLEYTIMSYHDDHIPYWYSSADPSNSGHTPTTPMLLDIVAAQRLYGLPISTPLSGGQTFGYNTNITGDLRKFYDFSVNIAPVVTIWDGGSNNVLDLSGTSGLRGNTVDLRGGTLNSVLGMSDNLGIAFGTRIETYKGGAATDTVVAGDFDSTIYGGGGSDKLFGGEGSDKFFIDIGVAEESGTYDGYGDIVVGGNGSDIVNTTSLRRQTNVIRYDRPEGVYNSRLGEYRYYDGLALNASGQLGRASLFEVENIGFRDGVLVQDASSNAAAVLRLYDTVLARTPDALGLDGWVHRLEAGASLVDVAAGFTASSEFATATGGLSNGDFVEYLYVHALGRGSDPAGKAGWTAVLDGGTSRASVTVGFSESPEERARTAGAVSAGLFVDDADYQAVAALYDTFADRRPDAQGLIDWGGALDGGRLTLAQVADGFAGSAEFAGRTAGLDNGALVDFMYRNTLDRGADPGGRAAWVAALDGGLSRGGLLLGFSQSAEHYQLIAPYITGGITVG